MNYCGQCGASVERIIPAGDTKPRDVAVGVVIFITRTLESLPVAYLFLRTRFCSVSARLSRDAENGRFQRAFLKMLRLSKRAQLGKRWRKLTLAFIVLNSIPSSACLISRRSICSIEQNSPTSTFLQARKVWRLGSTGKATFLG